MSARSQVHFLSLAVQEIGSVLDVKSSSEAVRNRGRARGPVPTILRNPVYGMAGLALLGERTGGAKAQLQTGANLKSRTYAAALNVVWWVTLSLTGTTDRGASVSPKI